MAATISEDRAAGLTAELDELDAGLSFIHDRIDRLTNRLHNLLEQSEHEDGALKFDDMKLLEKEKRNAEIAFDPTAPLVARVATMAKAAHRLGRAVDSLGDRVQI